MKTLTQAAQVAKAIKKELKEYYPNIKFSVQSKNFTGGNDVTISYTNAVPSKNIEKLIRKYEAGHFDGMTDMYNYDYAKTGITAKYIFVERHISDDVWEKAKQKIAQDFDIADISDESLWQKKFNAWSGVMTHRYLDDREILSDNSIVD